MLFPLAVPLPRVCRIWNLEGGGLSADGFWRLVDCADYLLTEGAVRMVAWNVANETTLFQTIVLTAAPGMHTAAIYSSPLSFSRLTTNSYFSSIFSDVFKPLLYPF
jgi:hypothetical protein